MRELSLHILDIVQNSIRASAEKVEIIIRDRTSENKLVIEIKDDGRGMNEQQKKTAADPFVTTRKTRRVGLGLSLFAQTAESCQGNMKITSEKGKGTVIKAEFQKDHIDRPPLGDISTTLVSIIKLNPELDLVYRHSRQNEEFVLHTAEIKSQLGEVSIAENKIINWLEKFIVSGIKNLYGGQEDEIT